MTTLHHRRHSWQPPRPVLLLETLHPDLGVCRYEIAIAIGVKGGNIQTILVESEQGVQSPVNIGHIQWLDMHDWKEWRAAGEAAWEQWHQAKLAEIIRVLESDEILQRLFNWQNEELHNFTRTLGSLFPVTKMASGEAIKPYHKSLSKWLVDKKSEMLPSNDHAIGVIAQ